MKKTPWLIAFTLLAVGPSAALAGKTRLSIGTYFSSGDYGGDKQTEIQSHSLSLRHRTGRWTFSGSIPYLRIRGSETALVDGEPTGATTTRSTRSGVGDLVLNVKRLVYYDKASKQGLSVRGKVKLPTADESKFLGSGETDYTLEFAPFKVLSDATLYGAVGYKIYGDTDATDYRNVWLGRIGVSYAINPNNDLGASFRYRQAITATSEAKQSIMVFHAHEFDSTWKLQTYAIGGLSDSTADYAGGISLLYNF